MYVRATKRNHKSVLWDRDPVHPDGEIFVKGDGEIVEAGESPAVLRALADGRLERVTDDADDKVIAIAPSTKATSGRGGKGKGKTAKAEETPPAPDTDSTNTGASDDGTGSDDGGTDGNDGGTPSNENDADKDPVQ